MLREEMTFEEMVDHSMQYIFNGLITGGTKEMKSCLFQAMMWSIEWRKDHDKKEGKITIPKEVLREWMQRLEQADPSLNRLNQQIGVKDEKN